MKEIKLYCCEVCGTNYNDKTIAKECERNHKAPVEYTPTKWMPKSVLYSGYPLAIIAEFSDGKKVRYGKGVVMND